MPGFAKFVVIKKSATKARKGINPFTKEPTILRSALLTRDRGLHNLAIGRGFWSFGSVYRIRNAGTVYARPENLD